jgi:2-polyprenyl-3-methyl-5-hydroxy-6-metoxy-1,4-benzoquinol methylase
VSSAPGASFYDSLAEEHHLIFKDWNVSIEWQASIFGPLIERHRREKLRILDCACGIGTQSLGLAKRGHTVIGADLSPAVIARARREASARAISAAFQIADMRDLSTVAEEPFHAAIAVDNALPHLSEQDIARTAHSIAAKLRPGGLFVASIRDYDELLQQRPSMQPPAFYTDNGRRRIVHQVWDWVDDRTYTLHLYITRETESGWVARHAVSTYRALLRVELSDILSHAGFVDIEWLMPDESGFYQPIILARYP